MISSSIATRGKITGNSIAIATAGRFCSFEIIYNYIAKKVNFVFVAVQKTFNYSAKKKTFHYPANKT